MHPNVLNVPAIAVHNALMNDRAGRPAVAMAAHRVGTTATDLHPVTIVEANAPHAVTRVMVIADRDATIATTGHAAATVAMTTSAREARRPRKNRPTSHRRAWCG